MAKLLTISLALLSATVCIAQEAPPRVSYITESGREVVAPVEISIGTDSSFIQPGGASLIITQPVPVVPPPVKPESTPGRRGKSRMVPTLPKEYEARDKNGDGQIGMYEWERSKYAEFVKLDKNGDGFLTPQELNAKGNSFGARTRGGILERDAAPNPGNLTAYAQKTGETFAFSVTGRTNGSIYGTGTYTTDSDLATAAVHAGILKDGEKGVVQVTIVESPNQFAGTNANGITSNSWQAYPSAYTLR